jgi:hypothetical protein
VALDVFVRVLQTEKDFIGQVVVGEFALFKRRDEVDVEVALRLGRGPVIRRTEE